MVGISQQAIDKIEKGVTRQSKFLPIIAARLGVGIAKLDPSLAGAIGERIISEDQIYADGQMPIFGSAEGGDGAIVVTFDPIDYERRPAMLATVKGAYGIYVVGDSMSPAYDPGDRVLIHPHLPASPGVDAVLFKTVNDNEIHAKLKRIVKITSTEWHLLQFNPKKEFAISRLEWPKCHVIVGRYNRR